MGGVLLKHGCGLISCIAGFVWVNKEKSATQCAFADYGVHYAGLQIQ